MTSDSNEADEGDEKVDLTEEIPEVTPPAGGGQTNSEAPEIPGVTVTEMLGRGGQGVVFRGYQDFLERDVAVKILNRSVDRDLARFRQEATILARLQHPNIVACHQAGVTEGNQCFMVLEFVDGGDLYDYVRANGPLSERSALALTEDLARGLKHGYEDNSRMIHRDVKPQNVLLQRIDSGASWDFRAKIVDLGLARCLEESMELTQPGAVMGTPSSMAPEQFDHPEQVDHRTDIYGLGCVMFYAMTGDPAFKGRTFTAIYREKTDAKRARPHRGLEISAGTGGLFDTMLAREQCKRPATYDELIDQIRRVRAELNKQSGVVRRSRFLLWLMGTILVIVGALSVFLATRRGSEPPPVGTDPPVPGAGGIEDPPRQDPEVVTPVHAGFELLPQMTAGTVLNLFPARGSFDRWLLGPKTLAEDGLVMGELGARWKLVSTGNGGAGSRIRSYPRGQQIADFEDSHELVLSRSSIQDKGAPQPYLVDGVSTISHAVPSGDWSLTGRLALSQEGPDDVLLSGFGLRRADGSLLEISVVVIIDGGMLGDKAKRWAAVRAAWFTADATPLLGGDSVECRVSKSQVTGEAENAATLLSGIFKEVHGGEPLEGDVVVIDFDLNVTAESVVLGLGDDATVDLGAPGDFSDHRFNEVDVFCRKGFVHLRDWSFQPAE